MYKLFINKNVTSSRLLKNALKKIGIDTYKVIYNKYGKPELKDSDIHFNISNKDDYAIIGISDKPIGVDIEKFSYRPKMLDRYFTKEEKEYILNSEDKEAEFTRMWVKKESYVKMIGKGLGFGLNNVDTFKLNKYFHISQIKNYFICVCTC